MCACVACSWMGEQLQADVNLQIDTSCCVPRWTFIALLLPVLAIVVYSLARDPIVPHLIKELWYRMQVVCMNRRQAE